MHTKNQRGAAYMLPQRLLHLSTCDQLLHNLQQAAITVYSLGHNWQVCSNKTEKMPLRVPQGTVLSGCAKHNEAHCCSREPATASSALMSPAIVHRMPVL